ncbi:MAG TPA: serine hydrolase domain-containing protein [Solirubrobacter sp.]
MKPLATVALAILGLACLPAASHAAGLQKDLDRLVAKGAPGAVLSVRHGDHTQQLASGLADRDAGTKMRPSHRVRIASLTKTYTATVVLQLVGEHRLALSDSVEQRLPGLVPNGAGITVRQLLHHTSGIADFELDPAVLEPYLAGDLDHRWAPRDLVKIAVSHPPLFTPGTRYAYSNTNYVLLGLIAEAVTGHPLEQELRARIFTPLRLRATSFPDAAAMPAPFAHGYRVFDQPPATDITGLNPYPWAAGAMVATAHDAARFYEALLGGRLLDRRLLREMKTTVENPGGDFKGQRYGLGLESFPTHCGVAWGHNGDIPGFLTYAFASAGGRDVAVLTVNQDAHSLPPGAGEAFYALIEKAYCG